MVLKRKHLIYKNRKNEFKKLLERAAKLDIVSAFVSNNDIFNDAVERATDGKLTVRLLAGISNAISDPDVLLKKACNLEIKVLSGNVSANKKNGVFHPKIYIFTDNSGQKEVLLGSANFTEGGLQRNEEVLLLLKDLDLIEEICGYFEELWEQAYFFEDKDNDYRNLHVSQRSHRVNIDNSLLKHQIKNRTLSLKLTDSLESQKKSFSKYCELLHETTRQHDSGTFLEEALDTLDEMRALIIRPKRIYSKEEINKLSGTSGFYMILGKQERWPLNTHVNEEDGKRALRLLRDFASADLPRDPQERKNKVLEVLENLTNIPFLKTGISRASRLMSIARPEIAFSYNSRSKANLDYLVGIENPKTTSAKTKIENYGLILDWIWTQPWYLRPVAGLNSDEKKIWDKRVALLDFLVYDYHGNYEKGLKERVLYFLQNETIDERE